MKTDGTPNNVGGKPMIFVSQLKLTVRFLQLHLREKISPEYYEELASLPIVPDQAGEGASRVLAMIAKAYSQTALGQSEIGRLINVVS